MNKAIFIKHSSVNGMGCWELKNNEQKEFKIFIHDSPLKVSDARSIEQGDQIEYDFYDTTQLGVDKIILQKIIKKDGTEIVPEDKQLTDFDKKVGISKEDKENGRRLIASCPGGYSQHAIISELSNNNPEHHKVLNGAISYLLDKGDNNKFNRYDRLFTYIENNGRNDIEINDTVFKELVLVAGTLKNKKDERGPEILKLLEEYGERYENVLKEITFISILAANNDNEEIEVDPIKP